MAFFPFRLVAICAGLLAMLGSACTALAAPSFSCDEASSPVDKLICAEPGLAAMDVALASAFHDAQGDAAKAGLLAEQRQWLAARSIACPDIAANLPANGVVRDNAIECVLRLYEQRVAVLRRTSNEAAWPLLPFRPTLVEGAGTKLCEALLSDIAATFLGASMIPNPLGTREIGFATIPGLPDGVDLRRADFDPYNGGKPMSVLLEINDDGGLHLGVARYRRFATPAALDQAIAKIRHQPDTPVGELGAAVFDTDRMQGNAGKRMAEPLPSFATDDMVYLPAMPRFFRADGKVYVYAPLALPDSSGLTGVYQLASPRLARRVCLFQAGPEPDLKLYEQVTDKADLSGLQAAAAPLLPHGMLCWAVGDDVRTRESRALWRPWSLRSWPELPGETDAETFARYMRNRGLTGLERNLQYRDYAAARDKTIAGYAQYYANAFGRTDTDARALAAFWADQGLSDDAELDPDEPEAKALLAADYADTHKAAAAALAGDANAAVAWQRGPNDEPLPTYALAHPDLLRVLLDKGFDPDEFGASGRTALMTAARLGLVEAASLLLDRGAKVDLGASDVVAQPYVEGDALCLRAGQPPEGDTPGRTALSYAAESASPAMVRLLLAHGADRAKPDNAGVTPQARAADRADPAAEEVRRLLASGP